MLGVLLEGPYHSTSHEYPQHIFSEEITNYLSEHFSYLGPVVQSIISLTSSLRVVSLTVLADSIHNILIFFAEKM